MPFALRPDDDLVVDVGEVDDVPDRVASDVRGSADHVEDDRRHCVANVRLSYGVTPQTYMRTTPGSIVSNGSIARDLRVVNLHAHICQDPAMDCSRSSMSP